MISYYSKMKIPEPHCNETVLLIVDVQNDFMPGGALAVPHGELIVEPINKLMGEFDTIVATQDWHFSNDESFASTHHVEPDYKTLWPDHCIAGTRGAEFHSLLDTSQVGHSIRKNGYSGYVSGLPHDVVIVGLATDYCVKHTAMDFAAAGHRVSVLLHCCRGIVAGAGIHEMANAGITIEE